MSNTISMIDLDAVSLLSEKPKNCNVVFNESQITISNDNGLGISYYY